jgi:imidazolonepropionase-like amidohydrolase
LWARKHFAIPGFVHAHDHGLFGAKHKKYFLANPQEPAAQPVILMIPETKYLKGFALKVVK